MNEKIMLCQILIVNMGVHIVESLALLTNKEHCCYRSFYFGKNGMIRCEYMKLLQNKVVKS